MSNQMFKKYLLKNDFWQTRGGNERIFIKHSAEYGGIYAKLLDRGVEINHRGNKETFKNFTELDDYLDRITTPTLQEDNNEFLSILNRKMTSKMLRSLPL